MLEAGTLTVMRGSLGAEVVGSTWKERVRSQRCDPEERRRHPLGFPLARARIYAEVNKKQVLPNRPSPRPGGGGSRPEGGDEAAPAESAPRPAAGGVPASVRVAAAGGAA